MKKKVIISACILGEYCRYDGNTKKINEVLEAFEAYEIIPFCPEAPLFGIPRERISVISLAGKNRIITDESNRDVTDALEKEIKSFIKKYSKIDAIVLKSKSPSCGNGTTSILDGKKYFVKYGDGIAAKIFKEQYGENLIKDEISFIGEHTKRI